jgi:hypothetical protein
MLGNEENEYRQIYEKIRQAFFFYFLFFTKHPVAE